MTGANQLTALSAFIASRQCCVTHATAGYCEERRKWPVFCCKNVKLNLPCKKETDVNGTVKNPKFPVVLSETTLGK